MAYESIIPAAEPVIGDHNYRLFLAPPIGMTTGYLARDFAAHPWDSDPTTTPFDLPVIARSEWDDRIEEMERDKSRLSDLYKSEGGKTKNQDGWGYCWVFGVTTALEIARAVQGQEYVELSASSAGLIIKNYRNEGGWGMEALSYLKEHGVCPVDLWPEVPSGAQTKESEQTKIAKLNYRVLEWYEVRTFEEVMTCLFYRIPTSTGHNWWTHQICQLDPIRTNGQFGSRILNSWGTSWGDGGYGVLTESKARPDGVAVAPRSIVVTGSDGLEKEVSLF